MNRDTYDNYVYPGDHIMWKDHRGMCSGVIEYDPTYTDCMRVGGLSFKHLKECSEWVKVVK